MFGQPQSSVGQSPVNTANTNAPNQPPSTFTGGRQKFVKKFQNNIHIIDDIDNKRSPYGGLFNL